MLLPKVESAETVSAALTALGPAKDLHARATRDRVPLLTSLQLCGLATRAAGITALDGAHLDLDDDAGFAAELGVDWARLVTAAHAEAVARGRGVVVLDRRLIENVHLDDARRVLALADAIAEHSTG